jgi:class 3 adenylate cyclase
MEEELASVSRRRFDGDPDRVFLVDQDLRVVAHASPERRGRSEAKRGLFADVERPRQHLTRDVALSATYRAEGRALLGVLQPLPELGWGIVVEQPRDAAYAAVRTTWVTALAVGASFMLVALCLGILLGRRLSAPILAIASAAGRVARGDFTARVEVQGGDEIGEMARSFNTMTEDLVRFEARVVDETRIRADLSRYLSAELVDGIVKQEIPLKLGGERRSVAVLFADVVAFTPLVERHEPEQIVAVLNELFTFLTEIVHRNGGMVDKFIGDSVMAVFGVPAALDDAPQRAVRAAEEMLRWLETGNVRWRKLLGQDLQLAIGINMGQAVAGNLGSERRMEYTVIGDVVNVAARLETMARPGQVLMTEEVAEAIAGEWDTEPLGEHNLPGRAAPLRLHALQP